MKKNLLTSLLPALAFPSLVLAQPVSTHLDAAAQFGRSAVGAGTLEQSRELSSRSFQGGAKFDQGAVDASGLGAASPNPARPALSASLKGSSLGGKVPAPSREAARSSRDSHPGRWAVAGLLAPVAGAVVGALVGGVPGAIFGVLAGACVGAVLLLVAAAKWLGRVFNP